jgi:lipoteichoic acid synthase
MNKPLNIPVRKSYRIGDKGAVALVLLLLALMLLRALVIVQLTAQVASCPACLGLTALQQDSSMLALLLLFTAASLVFRRYFLQLPWLLLGIVLVLVYAIDLAVLKTLTQRLYLFDVLKFGKEFGAIVDFGGVLLESTNVRIGLILLVPITAVLVFALYPRQQRLRAASIYFVMAIVFAVIGLWQPKTMRYIHNELLQNLISTNLDLGVDTPYSAAFAAQVARDYLSPKAECAPGQNRQPDVIYVVVESLSMHHSALFGGFRDLTPNLDGIAKQYTYFTNFFANGFTTDGGLIALVNGRVPVPAIGRYQSTDAFRGYDKAYGALPDILHHAGYTSHFFTTGDLGFLDKTDWLKALGFDSYEGAEQPFYNGWKRRHFNAAEDKALYQHFLQWLDQQHGSAPSFSMLLTVSTHPPFINPEDESSDEPGVFRYADKQIGMLYTELKQRDFFQHGILLISGDHRSMTPVFAEEIRRFGDSALARTPFIMVSDLPGLPHGVVDSPFQQSDLLPSLTELVQSQACRTSAQGWFLRRNPLPAAYVEHARGDKRDVVDIYFGQHQGDVVLNGDKSRWQGDKPADWQQITLGIHADRIQRGADDENFLDLIISLHRPSASPPTAAQKPNAPAPTTTTENK